MKHLGNMTITTDNAPAFAITDFYGHLTVGEGVEFLATTLQNVRGWVTLLPGASMTAPLLGEINGWLTTSEGSFFDAPRLTAVTRDVIIGSEQYNTGLTTVGSLTIQRNVLVMMDSLMRVSDGVSVMAKGWADLPALESIGGSITLREEAQMIAPGLKNIGGYYDADDTAVLNAFAFTS